MMEDKNKSQQLLELAVYAGELLLMNGAEMFRVEDTMLHILHCRPEDEGENAPERNVEVFALTTGIFASIQEGDEPPRAMMRRVYRHGSGLSRIDRVNQVSRDFCRGRCSAVEAMETLRRIGETREYGTLGNNVGYALACGGFALMLGGGPLDGILSALIGVLLLSSMKGASHLRLNDFMQNAAGAFVLAISALVLHQVLPDLRPEAVIIGCIMPLVPGVIFTTALRDILNGDYSSGIARVGETVVIALSVACGVGAAMRVFVTFGGTL